MPYSVLADLLVLAHLLFIGFAILGGLLCYKWRWLLILHVPTALWGILIEFRGWTCPLTVWEQSLRHMAGEQGYGGSFVVHYLQPILYPAFLTPNLQYLLGALLILVNTVIYGWLLWRMRQKKYQTDQLPRA